MREREKQRFNRRLGRRIASIRRRQRLKVDSLAGLAGLSHKRLRTIEDGTAAATIAEVERIAEALAVPLTHFFET